jgi:O-antigen/teichoic acid export membrane protein
MLLINLNTIPGMLLSATNGQKAYMFICFIAAVFNITTNILVIPTYGIIGSAYTMVATQALILTLVCYLFVRSGYQLPNITDVSKIVACTLLMGAAVYFARPYNLFAVVLMGAVIYFILILVTRSVSNDDYKLLLSIFAKKQA